MLVEIVVGRSQQRLSHSCVPGRGYRSVVTRHGRGSEAVLKRDGAHVLPMDVWAEAAPDTQMDVGNCRAWAGAPA